ncbi:MAG: PepSY domain-containing protein [Mediterranea sp.]|jgi:uncharacterized iron-regulated membrane protein|nr:PepSY domain-containing protein [Mediterranea sp.]
MKRLFKKLHLWLSLPFGIAISIICFSGAALVFETEIMEVCYRNRYFVDEVKEGKALPVDGLLAAVAETLPDSITITGVTFPSNPRRAYRVELSRPHRAAIYVDQYTGQIKGRHQRIAFFALMLRAHRWLFDTVRPGGGISWGKLAVGISTLLFVVILITGAVIWVPKTIKGLKNRLLVTVNKGRHRFLYDLHVSTGMYAFIFLLLMALTGLTWSFPWYRTGFYRLFGVDVAQTGTRERGGRGGQSQQEGISQRGNRGGRSSQEMGSERSERGKKDDKRMVFAQWQAVYDHLNRQNPGNRNIGVSKGAATVSFNRFGNRMSADRYTFDEATGEITSTTLYRDQPNSGKIRGWVYSLHVGSWGGLFTRILAFLAAIIGGLLPLTGYYLWLRKIVKKRKA